ncbi:MAG: hypothetical protein RJB38_1254, partial [Pseudomonadota bacterium]
MIRFGSSLLQRAWVVPGALLSASLLGISLPQAKAEESLAETGAASVARSGKVIEKVRVEGLQRIEEAAVLA